MLGRYQSNNVQLNLGYIMNAEYRSVRANIKHSTQQQHLNLPEHGCMAIIEFLFLISCDFILQSILETTMWLSIHFAEL